MLFEFIFQVELPNLTAQRHAPTNAYALIELVFERRGNEIRTLGRPYFDVLTSYSSYCIRCKNVTVNRYHLAMRLRLTVLPYAVTLRA